MPEDLHRYDIVDAHGMPLKVVVTQGTRADCMEAEGLIDGFKMEHLLADKGYDSDAIVAKAQQMGAQAVIPSRKNRKQPREYDKHLYKLRIWLRMLSCISSAGVASPPVMPRTCLLSSPLSTFAAWLFG